MQTEIMVITLYILSVIYWFASSRRSSRNLLRIQVLERNVADLDSRITKLYIKLLEEWCYNED